MGLQIHLALSILQQTKFHKNSGYLEVYTHTDSILHIHLSLDNIRVYFMTVFSIASIDQRHDCSIELNCTLRTNHLSEITEGE